MKGKKVLVFLAALFLAASVTAGCGTQGGRQTESNYAQDSDTSASALMAEESAEPENGGENAAGNTSGKTKDSAADTSSSESEESGFKKGTICRTTDTVNFRVSPSLDAAVITTLPLNSQVTYDSEKNGFAKVSCQGRKGYISLDYLRKDLDASSDVSEGSVRSDKNSSTKSTLKADAAGSEKSASGNGYIVVIDPGHQAHANSSTEPIGPGSRTKKAKVTGGTSGVSTGVPEYKLTLVISKKLRKELRSRGYTVYLTRTSNDVDISNAQRARYATKKKADIYVRVHANGGSSSAHGALMLYPTASNQWVGSLSGESRRLSRDILKAYCKATGMKNLGNQPRDDMTGFNWATMPMTLIELGFMTNSSDDVKMEKTGFQKKMVKGMANGIDDYFGV